MQMDEKRGTKERTTSGTAVGAVQAEDVLAPQGCKIWKFGNNQ